MKPEPPVDETDDELAARYRRASATDPSRPSESVREAIRAYARRIAAEPRNARSPLSSRGERHEPTALGRRWAAWGAVAAAAVVALIAIPLYREPLTPSAPAVQAPVHPAEPSAAPDRTAVEAPAPQASAPPLPKPSPRSMSAARTPAISPPAPLQTPSRDREPASASRASSPADANATIPSGSVAGPAAAGRVDESRYDRAPRALVKPSLPAAAAGDLREPERQLRAGREADAPDEHGHTALMRAILSRHPEVVAELLAHGADPNAADADGATPLAVARAQQLTEIARLLEQAGAH